MELSVSVLDWFGASQLFLVAAFLAALLYYAKFVNYQYQMKSAYNPKRKNIGNALPPYPNGWFMVSKSDELKPKQVKNIEYWGSNIVLFRGQDNKPYALDAYCAHMGASLGVEGVVKNGNNIQCPFHGWSYDGETGYCVDYNKKPIRGMSVEYTPETGECGHSQVKWIEKQEDIRLRKYPLLEQNGYIFIWLHGNPEFQNNPTYTPPNLERMLQGLSYRGKALNIVRCHIQDIPENGADVMHFFYVHKYVFSWLKQLWIRWVATWVRGDISNLQEKFVHKAEYVHKFKQEIYKGMLEKYESGGALGIVNVDSHINIPWVKQFYAFNITVIQVGSGVVYILVKTYFFTLVFVQYIQTDGRYTQNVYHELYCSKWMPYWFSALFLKVESIQVYNDAKIWDAKQFKRKVCYQNDSKADGYMKAWRQWYGQFYDGANLRRREDLTF